jgi:hypothetical protein
MAIDLRDLGVHRFAGIGEPLRVFGVGAQGLGWIDRPLRSVSVTGNVPAPSGRFVGRDQDVSRLGGELHSRRPVTLTGSAGVGKDATGDRGGPIGSLGIS